MMTLKWAQCISSVVPELMMCLCYRHDVCLCVTPGHIYSGLRDGRIVKINITDETVSVITSIVDESTFHCGKLLSLVISST